MALLDYLPAEQVYLALARRRGAIGPPSLRATGNVYWLDNSDSAKSDTPGKGSFFAPFATLSFAVSQLGSGDTLIVKQGHDETLTATVTLSFDDITITGEGWGDGRPRFNLGASGDIEMKGDRLTLQNLRFLDTVGGKTHHISPGVSNIVGWVMADCEFRIGSGLVAPSNAILDMTKAEAALLIGCRFYMSDAGTDGPNAIRVVAAGLSRMRIADCFVFGTFSGACIVLTDNSGDDSEGVIIEECGFYNADTSAANLIAISNCKGVIRHNGGYSAHGTLNDVVSNDACAMIENYFTNNLSNAGGIVPTTRAS